MPAQTSKLGPITSVSIDRLFGRYSYEFASDPVDDPFALEIDFRRLSVLYGDNGAGKTTILMLMFHLLSPSMKRGHRSFVAQIPFRRFSIQFGSTAMVSAERRGNDLVGSYDLTFKIGGTFDRTIRASVSRDGIVRPDAERDQVLAEGLKLLEVYPIYLSDRRVFHSDLLNEPQTGSIDEYIEHRRYLDSVLEFQTLERRLDTESATPFSHDEELDAAIHRTENWFRSKALADTSVGILNASNVYFDILEKMATGDSLGEQDFSTSYEMVQGRLTTLSTLASEYAEFELGGQFPAERFTHLLAQARPDQREQLSRALVPHLDTSEAQISALRDLYMLLVNFTSSLNSMFKDKFVEFRALNKGLSIRSIDGHELPPSALSSGERQLLLLLCNTIIARDSSRLFIIDEPEISLNIKWQRRLLNVLLECTAGTNLQFFVATHSIEMIASHQDSLARLVNTHGA